MEDRYRHSEMADIHQIRYEGGHRFPPTPVPSSDTLDLQPVVSIDLPADYRLLLLSLADRYVSEARSMSAFIAHGHPGADLHRYHKLIATGLACYETVLQKYRLGLSPRQEALVQLRYAMILYEETESDHLAEAILGRAIPFCERNRLLGIKYSMQHLLARVLFKKKPKAGLKFLDNTIQEATACEHIVWIYALRFLRVSLSLQQQSSHELHAAMSQLEILAALAKDRGDKAVCVMASIIEASIHLSQRDSESLTEAQRAIASARSKMMSQTTRTPFQLQIMVSMLDLACSLDPHSESSSKKKMLALQEVLEGDEADEEDHDGFFYLPIEQTEAHNLTRDSGGIFTTDAQDHDCLTFSWLAGKEPYHLAFFMCAATVFPKRRETTEFIEGGLEATTHHMLGAAQKPEPLKTACSRIRRRDTLRSYLLLYLALVKLDASEWTQAQNILRDFHTTLDSPGLDPFNNLRRFAVYLDGVTNQSIGNLDAAIAAFDSPFLSVPPPHERSASYLQTCLSLLAAMNLLLIIGPPTHPLHARIFTIGAQLSPHFPNVHKPPHSTTPTLASLNPQLTTIYLIVLTTLTPSHLTKKQHLQQSLNIAKTTNNKHHLVVSLAYLYDFLFKGIIGDQGVKSAKAAVQQAQLIDNNLLNAVTSGHLAMALELEGAGDQSRTMERLAEGFTGGLAPGLVATMETNVS